jgi:4-carboxymuconolactone decarboxylase
MLEDPLGVESGRMASSERPGEVSLVSDEVANPAQLELFAEVAAARGDVLNVYRAMAHSPELARRVGSVGAFLRGESALPARLREAVILATAAHWDCAYQQIDHGLIGLAVGLSPAAIEDLGEGTEVRDISDLERDVLGYVRSLLADGRPRLELLRPLTRAFDEKSLVELHLLAGYYSMVAFFINGLAIPPGPSAVDVLTRGPESASP